MIGLSKLIGKLVFVEFVELKMFQRVRRERIYPFRLGNDFIWAILNGKILDNTVGRVDHFLFNEPRMFISLSERINPFPTKHPGKFQFINMLT